LIRIISANLAGAADAVLFAKLAHALRADAVAVQQLATLQAEALASMFPFGRLEVSPHRMGIALAQPAVVRMIPLTGRSAYAVEVADSSEEQITVINAHLIAPHVGPPWRIGPLRRRQVHDLDAYLRSVHRPLVLVGDLNSTPLWPAYRRLSRTLTDAAVVAARLKRRRPARTWGFLRGPRLFRIDHVLVTGVIVENVQVLPIVGSDHSAVVVDVRQRE